MVSATATTKANTNVINKTTANAATTNAATKATTELTSKATIKAAASFTKAITTTNKATTKASTSVNIATTSANSATAASHVSSKPKKSNQIQKPTRRCLCTRAGVLVWKIRAKKEQTKLQATIETYKGMREANFNRRMEKQLERELEEELAREMKKQRKNEAKEKREAEEEQKRKEEEQKRIDADEALLPECERESRRYSREFEERQDRRALEIHGMGYKQWRAAYARLNPSTESEAE